MSLTIQIDATDWDRSSEALIMALGGKDTPLVNRAVLRAIRKTMRWTRRRVLQAAAALGITQKVFDRARIAVRGPDDGEWTARMWVGTDPFPAHRLGPVRWSRRMSGARAGRTLFPGTFAHRTAGPIFKRTGETPRRMSKGRYAGKLREPINKVHMDIHDAMDINLHRIEAAAAKRYHHILYQELNYEIQKANNRA